MATATVSTAAETEVETAQAQVREAPKKMSVMGVGGKIAVPVLLYIVVAGLVSWILRPLFRITSKDRSLRVAGTALATAGFSLNLVAAFHMLKAHREDRLATHGPYRLFRDPMYVQQIFITLPGMLLFFNSWLVLPGVIPAYIAYRVFVKEEHAYLEERYGEAYREYLKRVLLKI